MHSTVARATRNIEPHEKFPSSPGATICLGQYDCSAGMCSVHLLFSKWYQDFGLVRQIHMYIRTITRNAYILHKKPHTQTHKQPGSVGAQFHSSVYGLPQRRNWSGIIVSSSSVLYDVDLRAEAQRVGWLGVKDQNGLMSLLFEELTEQRSNRLEIKVCSPGG